MQKLKLSPVNSLALMGVVVSLGLSLSHGAISFGAGLKGGVNFGNAAAETANGDEVDIEAGRLGLAAGGFVEFGVTSPFSLVVEALYTQTGAKTEIASVNGEAELSYLEFPILVKAKFGRKDLHAYVFAGPNIGFNLTAEATFAGVTFNDEDNFTSINFAGDIGVGASAQVAPFVFLVADARYSHGFSNIIDESLVLNNYMTRDIKLMVGVLFHLTE